MFITTENTAHDLAFLVFFFSAVILCVSMLISGFLLGGRSQDRSKNIPFESGVNPVGTTKLKFSAKFYLVAICFVIFDVEALFIYAWSVVIRETGWLGFIEMNIFIFILLLGLLYLVHSSVLDWAPTRSRLLNADKASNKKIPCCKKS